MQREKDRLTALEQLDLLDTPSDEGFERIVRLVKAIFAIDFGLISLIDAHRQWYKACSGLFYRQGPWRSPGIGSGSGSDGPHRAVAIGGNR